MSPKRPASFRLDDEILEALQEIKEREGITVADQVDRALIMWLDSRGRHLRRRGEVMRLIERLNGLGTVKREGDGREIGARRYNLAVWQQVHQVEAFGGERTEIEGLRSVEGTISFDADELFGLMGENLVLTLEDGRTFPFFLQDTNGRIAARGSLQ